MPDCPRSRWPAGRAFTLIELIVVILILGILAALAVVGYATITQRAHVARAETNLSNVAKATLVRATVQDADLLDRGVVHAAFEDSFDVTVDHGISAADPWRLGFHNQAPARDNDYSVGFDNGVADGVGQDEGGTRAVFLAKAGDETLARIVVWGGAAAGAGDSAQTSGTVPNGTTPSDVLADPALIGAAGPDDGAGEVGTGTPPAQGGPAVNDPDDVILNTGGAGVNTGATPTSMSKLDGPTVPWSRVPAQAVSADAGGYLLESDGTVSVYDNGAASPVPGLTDVVQIADNPMGSGYSYALHADGTVSLLDGTTFTPSPLTGVKLLVVDQWGRPGYALHTDSTLTTIASDGSLTPVVGITDARQVAIATQGAFVTHLSGEVSAIVDDAVVVAIPGLSNVQLVAAGQLGSAYALHKDGTLSGIGLQYDFEQVINVVRFPGIEGVTRVSVKFGATHATVLTAAGDVYLADCGVYTAEGCQGQVLDIGLSDVTTIYGLGSQEYTWALTSAGTVFQIQTPTSPVTFLTEAVVLPTTLTGVTQLADSGQGMIYTIHEDQSVKWSYVTGPEGGVATLLVEGYPGSPAGFVSAYGTALLLTR